MVFPRDGTPRRAETGDDHPAQFDAGAERRDAAAAPAAHPRAPIRLGNVPAPVDHMRMLGRCGQAYTTHSPHISTIIL